MRQARIVILLLSTIMLFCPGCPSEPGLDKNKFAELNRTARELKSSLASSKPCEVPDALLQELASETTAVKNKTDTKRERDVIKAYSLLLATYEDGLLLCKHRNRLHQYQFVPKGRIYVFQELDPLVDKYDLPTERHVYKPTGAQWRSVAWDSIYIIWDSAELQTKNIENMVNYN